MQSKNTDDWDRGIEVLDELEQKDADHKHRTEVEQFRKQYAELLQQRSRRRRPRTSTRRARRYFYNKGLRLRQEGKEEQAGNLAGACWTPSRGAERRAVVEADGGRVEAGRRGAAADGAPIWRRSRRRCAKAKRLRDEEQTGGGGQDRKDAGETVRRRSEGAEAAGEVIAASSPLSPWGRGVK